MSRPGFLSRGNAPSGGNPWGWWVLTLVLCAILFAVGMLLTGCGLTREESTHAATDVSRRFALKGSVAIPTTRASDGATVLVPVAVDLVLDGGGTDETNGEARARTQVEAPELAGAVVAGLRTAFPALALLGVGQAQMGQPPSAWSNLDTGTTAAAGVAIAGLLQRHMAAKSAQANAAVEAARADAERRRAEEHKADAAEGWAHAAARKGGA